MNAEQQRIAIAEACGWKRHEKHRGLFFHESGKIQPKIAPGESLHRERMKKQLPCRDGVELLPNYLEDLNAMREALLTLAPAKQCEFGERLAAMLGYDDDHYTGWNMGACGFFEAATIGTGKLSECFLRTLNLWKD